MIEILDKGFFTLAVSGERRCLERFGVPSAGPLDRCRCLLANRLVGNPDNAGALEAVMTVPRLRFLDSRSFALTGGPCGPRLLRNGQELPVPMGEAVLAQTGDELTGDLLQAGSRVYLAVSGGIEDASGQPVCPGDRLKLGEGTAPALRRMTADPLVLPGQEAVLRVTEGVHAGHFSPEGLAAFYQGPYVCSPQSDRMGIRFSGEAAAFAPGRDGNILSEGMLPGDIQVTSAGQPILMLEACQTVGGYAKIAHVITADLPVAAQLRPGAAVRFRLVSLPEAQAAWRKLWYKMSCCIEDQT